MADPRPVARVLFDESHSPAWSIRPEIARAMQPSHPADSSYAAAADALRRREFAVRVHTDAAAPLDAAVLAGADVLVLAHPSDPRWEAVVPGGSPVLSGEELDAIEAWVHAGGGLVVLGETEEDKYGANLNALVARFGVSITNATVSDYEAHHGGAPHWVLADLAPARDGVDLLARVDAACFYRAATLDLEPGRARALARAGCASSAPGAPLLAVAEHGAGRVVVAADSDLFGDDCLGDLSHEALWVNLVTWAAAGAFAQPLAQVPSSLAADPAWAMLKAEVEVLRARQQADGSVDLAVHPEAELHGHVDVIAGAVGALAVHVPHQAAYVEAVVADLRRWAAEGFARPDFGPSLEVFRPDLHRRDGIEHLVLFPMYKQNGSRDKVFEALVVRVPWPEWLAELEAGRYDNAKFVPVTLVDFTSGYDSECAVLFPETVSVAGRPANHFGAIFCDREAARFRRTSSAAADVLRLNLPPDAAALLASEALSRDAYELWDLVHDRTHSHGDLPFDPFMIRQRMPYWMYSLEELRCDLTAYAEAVRLEGEGLSTARHAQYAILFDRLFRFPITGPRVRNYDGLGGQLLFAYLHRTRRLSWTDNRLTIDWEHVADGVLELRALVEELYKAGIDRTKVQHWAAAHDLVATYVPPATGSQWAAGVRNLPDVEDPRPYIDLVLPDEFPLSIFFSSLRQKLAPPAPVAA
ncbi:MAG: FIG01122858: hypothetical protein [uncultured Solirubrobacteraceae bacterium]|uniref:DUF4350 domain-containing protein n=1 Tax=uncultured Solirubrobacteraceae bacterium TaxID=1162706 RepID=A0A6J4TRI6_9ACTN|nr:MAG: FIG01122858: hypothetical protein [uncultured Solirubrobacteraceae bacterium]